MGSNRLVEQTYEAVIQRTEELERQCNALIATNDTLTTDAERKDVLIGRLEFQLVKTQRALLVAERSAAQRLERIQALCLATKEVHVFNALSSVATVLDALTDMRQRGELCDVRAVWAHDERAVGIALTEVPDSFRSEQLRAATDARLQQTLIPGKDFGSAEQFKRNQEKP